MDPINYKYLSEINNYNLFRNLAFKKAPYHNVCNKKTQFWGNIKRNQFACTESKTLPFNFAAFQSALFGKIRTDFQAMFFFKSI